MKLTRKIEKTFRLDTYTSRAALRNLNRIQWILRNGSADTGTFLRTWLNRELRQQWHARGQAQKVDRVVTEALERLRIQVIRADQILTGALEVVDEAGTKFRNTLWGPIRQASAVMKGIKVGLDMLRRQQNNKPDRDADADSVSQDEELFI